MKKQDFIYINSAVIFSYIFLTFFKKYPSIIHVHEIPVGLIRFYFCVLSILSKSKVITNSNATKNGLYQNSNISVLYNGVKNITMDIQKKEQSEILHLSLIGRLNSWKGQNIAIEAIFLLIRRGISDIKLNIVGSYFGNNHYYLSYLKEMVHYYRLEKYVEFHDFCEDVSKHYQQSDIILVPSINPEPFGLVAIEAMNFRLPVIASNHGGLPEIIIHGQTGTLVEPNSAQDLASAIEVYYHDRSLLNNHGQNGKTRFLEYFEEEKYNDSFIQIVEKYAR